MRAGLSGVPLRELDTEAYERVNPQDILMKTISGIIHVKKRLDAQFPACYTFFDTREKGMVGGIQL